MPIVGGETAPGDSRERPVPTQAPTTEPTPTCGPMAIPPPLFPMQAGPMFGFPPSQMQSPPVLASLSPTPSSSSSSSSSPSQSHLQHGVGFWSGPYPAVPQTMAVFNPSTGTWMPFTQWPVMYPSGGPFFGSSGVMYNGVQTHPAQRASGLSLDAPNQVSNQVSTTAPPKDAKLALARASENLATLFLRKNVSATSTTQPPSPRTTPRVTSTNSVNSSWATNSNSGTSCVSSATPNANDLRGTARGDDTTQANTTQANTTQTNTTQARKLPVASVGSNESGLDSHPSKVDRVKKQAAGNDGFARDDGNGNGNGDTKSISRQLTSSLSPLPLKTSNPVPPNSKTQQEKVGRPVLCAVCVREPKSLLV